MKNTLMMSLVLGAMMSTSALAKADLAKSRNCMACHAIDKKVVGPGFKEKEANELVRWVLSQK